MIHDEAEELQVEQSSGNVFADVELPDSEERLAKALLSRTIKQIIQQRGWSQAQAAKSTRIAASDMSDIVRGKLVKFSLSRLETIILDLGMDIHMRVSPKQPSALRGHMSVELVPA
jgi:predicted XRE-type DNA-binding protein